MFRSILLWADCHLKRGQLNAPQPKQITPDTKITTCSAEDLVVYKAFANRGQDWADIERVLMRQMKRLNVDLIFEELRPLLQLKGEPEIEERLRKMIAEETLSE